MTDVSLTLATKAYIETPYLPERATWSQVGTLAEGLPLASSAQT